LYNYQTFTVTSTDYYTPPEFFSKLNEEFHFDLDPCTSKSNPLGIKNFFTKEDDGLSKSWEGFTTYINPPFGRIMLKWIKKAIEESDKPNAKTIVMLLPARVNTNWFHDLLYNKPRIEIKFIKGRLNFGGKHKMPFPNMVVIINPR
jgi:phage N-6-adenine-methyltransferase